MYNVTNNCYNHVVGLSSYYLHCFENNLTSHREESLQPLNLFWPIYNSICVAQGVNPHKWWRSFAPDCYFCALGNRPWEKTSVTAYCSGARENGKILSATDLASDCEMFTRDFGAKLWAGRTLVGFRYVCETDLRYCRQEWKSRMPSKSINCFLRHDGSICIWSYWAVEICARFVNMNSSNFWRFFLAISHHHPVTHMNPILMSFKQVTFVFNSRWCSRFYEWYVEPGITLFECLTSRDICYVFVCNCHVTHNKIFSQNGSTSTQHVAREWTFPDS